MKQINDLSGTWRLSGTDVDLAATVPGCVHTDLLAVGRIPDPFLDDNELKVAWVGRQDWTYQRDIGWDGPVPDRIDLVFEGLDTVARIEIDGAVVGETRNMHRAYRFDVTSRITAESSVAVHFTSAYTEAEQWRDRLGDRPNAYPEPFPFIRKMAASFGWDWGPTLVTAGIWRPVRLEGWSTARIAAVRPLATYAGSSGKLDLAVDIERTRDRALQAKVLVNDREIAVLDLAAGETGIRREIDVPGVTPWNPIGYGEPALHMVTVILTDGDDAELDRYQQLTGFRTVHIDRSADDAGTRFVIHVNGQPVLVKGVNWIPDDIFPSRMTRQRYELRLRQAADAGVNLIRVWGGGIYEDRAFYELCDELGLMVWQDFLFACACYPEEEPIRSEVHAEARDNITRLSPHPSLITWNGNNENLWLHEAMGWNDHPGGDLSWGSGYYLTDLPTIVAELDPTRPYQAGSPWSGSPDLDPNSPDHQTMHSWEVWNREDYLHYRDTTPRFVAEFGWQAPPAWRTLRDAVTDEPMRPGSPGVLHHQKAEDGNGKLARGLAPHFPEPASTEAWHYLTQLNQVRAVRTGIDHWRSHWPHTAGTIVWQLNDLWPVTSWAAIDGAGRLKPLYFALRALYADRRLTIEPRDGGLAVAILNDHAAPWTGDLMVEHRDTGGAVLATTVIPVSAAARSVTLTAIDHSDAALVVATLGDVRALHHTGDTAVPDGGLTVTAEIVPGGLDVHLHATGLARDILLQPDRIHPDAVVDQGFVTLLPGESTTLHVRAPAELDPHSIKEPWVVTDLAAALSGR
ncbi:glycoside hydrolase family 2 protein [Actinoplanes derwentensis]|uniref:beta-mannosidase n=1 Tax=Actinoplanes derwentensis TaxID=113562 RepID=A0A1H1XC84_9ACTN|nr:glycoside hydrolase family 2 protein [Actinoplanes derwentensis]GID89622.1 beta-mannosidase [Actinoplanes derwentensis]SDT06306.1 beta-mannosidase [Actinoplanes derwentensis]